jgi:hypothetical protein
LPSSFKNAVKAVAVAVEAGEGAAGGRHATGLGLDIGFVRIDKIDQFLSFVAFSSDSAVTSALELNSLIV